MASPGPTWEHISEHGSTTNASSDVDIESTSKLKPKRRRGEADSTSGGGGRPLMKRTRVEERGTKHVARKMAAPARMRMRTKTKTKATTATTTTTTTTTATTATTAATAQTTNNSTTRRVKRSREERQRGQSPTPIAGKLNGPGPAPVNRRIEIIEITDSEDDHPATVNTKNDTGDYEQPIVLPTIISSDSEPEDEDDRQWLQSFADAFNASGEANFAAPPPPPPSSFTPLPGSKAYSYTQRRAPIPIPTLPRIKSLGSFNPLVQSSSNPRPRASLPSLSKSRLPSSNPLIFKPKPPSPSHSDSSSSSNSNSSFSAPSTQSPTKKQKALALLALLGGPSPDTDPSASRNQHQTRPNKTIKPTHGPRRDGNAHDGVQLDPNRDESANEERVLGGTLDGDEDDPTSFPPLDYVDCDGLEEGVTHEQQLPIQPLEPLSGSGFSTSDIQSTQPTTSSSTLSAFTSSLEPAQSTSQFQDAAIAVVPGFAALHQQNQNRGEDVESGSRDSGDESEIHVQNMVDARNDPHSSISPVEIHPPNHPSRHQSRNDRNHMVALSEPMAEVPITETELAGRSIASRSPSSADDLHRRRSSRPRRPTQQHHHQHRRHTYLSSSRSDLEFGAGAGAGSESESESYYETVLFGIGPSSSSSVSSNAGDGDTPPRSTTPEDQVDPLNLTDHIRTTATTATSTSGSLSLGGFPIITWAQTCDQLRLQPPPHRYSKDLSHIMHDYINSYNPEMQNYPQMRHVYESMMRENTSLDEPDAPEIKIYNEMYEDMSLSMNPSSNDGGGGGIEPTPPWEFFYTNDMLLGRDVAPPSRANLSGCDCEGGKCHLNKTTCGCWKKQEAQTAWYGISGFMYDQEGSLKKNGLPVFECNSLCGCGEQCRNRFARIVAYMYYPFAPNSQQVVSQGRKCKVMLKKTEKKGWGVFACERIPKGTFIGIYSGELLGHEESEERAIKYDQFGRTYLFDIDWWYIDAELDAKEAKEKESKDKDKETLKTTYQTALLQSFVDADVDNASAVDKGNAKEGKGKHKNKTQNGDGDLDSGTESESESDGERRRPSKYTIDAYHAGNFTRFLNHSCDPNAALTPVYIDVDEIERPLLTIFSKREIKNQEEITFSYSGDPDVDDDVVSFLL
ncbi:hypothetical protein C8J55DRAFT_562708 [Lentinula edodes]|uniref:SET domain-containing protein n=1 Tax=Lentinula lateritia TaxID=40482 RepID=A0A9W9A4H6_9AGAR|nr:hypothetical protein C8J55DRAFT_562708 [Lentinula edodes]